MGEFWRAPVEHFDKAHKMFLQLVLSHNMILVDEVGPTFLKIYSALNNNNEVLCLLSAKDKKDLLQVLLDNLNERLRLIGMRAVCISDETRRTTEYLAIVSDRGYSEVMAQASGFTKDELAKFQVWLRMMYNKRLRANSSANNADVENENSATEEEDDEMSLGELHINKALNSRVGGFSTSGAQKLINKFVNAHWLVVDSVRDVLRLHPRAATELANGLQLEFNLPVCKLCQCSIFLRRLAYCCACEFFYHARCILKANEKRSAKCFNEQCDRDIKPNVVDFIVFDEDIQPGQKNNTQQQQNLSQRQQRNNKCSYRHKGDSQSAKNENQLAENEDNSIENDAMEVGASTNDVEFASTTRTPPVLEEDMLAEETNVLVQNPSRHSVKVESSVQSGDCSRHMQSLPLSSQQTQSQQRPQHSTNNRTLKKEPKAENNSNSRKRRTHRRIVDSDEDE